MKRLESNELRNHYYNFPMTVCLSPTYFSSIRLVISTCMCYNIATLNYYFSNSPSSTTPQALAYAISSVSDVIPVLLQPPRQTLTTLQDSVSRSYM